WLIRLLLVICCLLNSPNNVMSAPNLLRVGTTENVFVEAQDYTGADIPVRVVVKNHPRKNIELASKQVLLSSNNNFQQLVDIKIMENKDAFSEDPLEKQYVYLEAHFPTSVLEKVVMVSFQSGYIFVQTDKSIYTPQSTVKYRIFSVTPDLQPLDQNGISIEIINPQGIILHRDLFFPKQGILTGTYDIPDVASPGIWSIATRFKNTPQKNFTAEFEVKEYVLPTFEVSLRPAKSFFYVDDDKLEVEINARYLSGNRVDGIAFVVFGVIQGDSKTSLPASLRRVSITEGEGKAELTREMILKTFKSVEELVGSSLYISVSVLTEAGSEMVEAQRRGIQIVTSPYTIHFKRTPKFFKPGIHFDVTVYVTNPDDSPAERVEVVVNPGNVPARTRSNGMAMVTLSTLFVVSQVKTNNPDLTPARQDEKQFIAEAYATKGGSNNYLHIGVEDRELTVGTALKIYLHFAASPGVQNNQDFTYLILSKGQIVQAKRFKRDGQSLVAQSILVTKDMLPSFRVVAYYHVGASEVVADSVWVDVKDTCMGTLKVKAEGMKIYEPGERFSLSITGDPGAKVGLVAVDKGVFVLNKNRLTQNKIWDIIEKHDTGCTAGSGKDSMGVFYDAGLVFHSDKADGTTERTSRIDLFIYFMFNLRNFSSLNVLLYIYSCISGLEHILLFNIKVLCALVKNSFLRDSLTTWQVLAVSLSPTHGICVADPFEMVVRKSFFVDLKLPYSAVRNEQLEIKAVLHNYSNKKREKVLVVFRETKDVCSAASKKGKYRTTVSIDAMSSRSISYFIIPMKLGNFEIEVKAVSIDSGYGEAVKKQLKVVIDNTVCVVIFPVLLFTGGVQEIRMKSDIPNGQIPNTPAHTYITVTGQEVSQNIEQVISGDLMGRLIVQPFGSGEDTMILMTYTLTATHYLDTTKQWEAVGMQRRAEAIKHLQAAYQRELTYRKADGSYGAWINRQSSTWLTAYVSKVFTLASNLIRIDEKVLCGSLKWLVLNTQTSDGMFREDAPVIHGEMVGDVRGKDAEASLTAFVLIAMQEGRKLCTSLVPSLPESMNKAIDYLSSKIPTMTNPYAIAMTSYAMANADKFNKDLLMKFSSGDLIASRSHLYWQVSGGHHFTLEASAYALLALVKVKDFEAAGKVVHWLNSQTSPYGNSGTTQATIMVFQAVAEYYKQVKTLQDAQLEVILSISGRSRPTRWLFKRENPLITRTERKIKEQERSDKACEDDKNYGKHSYIECAVMCVFCVVGSERVEEGQVRSFMGHPKCRESFGFKEGKSYLIMGRSADLLRTDGRLQYILGEQTWIEYWPTSEEGQSSEFEDQYLGIQDLTQKLIYFGCLT
uniref:Complement component c3a, duplicate 1 n=2 Tax=Astyanax mexicanus TaxID=7994 RepID=A0A8B9JMQ1_ASTMX